jgi:hypothetical protein
MRRITVLNKRKYSIYLIVFCHESVHDHEATEDFFLPKPYRSNALHVRLRGKVEKKTVPHEKKFPGLRRRML